MAHSNLAKAVSKLKREVLRNPVGNPGYFAIPQVWLSTGDARPVRDLMRDLETVNRGEP